MKARFYYGSNDVHNRCVEAMYEGCPFDKERAALEDYRPSDIAVVFGMKKWAVSLTWPRGVIFEEQQRHLARTVVIDSGYVRRGDGPNDYYSVGTNGLNGRASFHNALMPGDRWQALDVSLKPYREDGGHFLLCGQVPWDASVQHIDFCAWAQGAGYMIHALSQRPFIWRPHPNAKTRILEPAGAWQSRGSLDADLKGCWAVVTFNSNTAVEAAIKGYPVFAFDQGSMAWAVANKNWNDLERPYMQRRQQWAHDLAYTQWTPQEMREGKPWEHLFR